MIVVIGSTGQLARHLRELLPKAQYLSRSDVDLADGRALEDALRGAHPSCIVNAAAYTAVDRAESEPALAWSVNVDAPARMARIAHSLSVPLIHVSTDYVFGGQGDGSLSVNDSVNPPNVYGRTKLAGELAVRTLCTRQWTLRTSWVFSEHGNNFVKTMLRLAAERPELRVVDDQRGRPTYARDLAKLIVHLATTPGADATFNYGAHHATGGPAVSWREFADLIVRLGFDAGLLSRRVPVIGIRAIDYPTPAKRPANSVLEPSVSLQTPGSVQFDWQAGLARVINILATTSA